MPRVLALVIALPLLTIVADLVGIAGGALLCHWLLDMPFDQYLTRANEAITPTTFWVGIIKAPVFAVLIAIAGCYRGMQVRDSARELGRLTTVAVVQAIFLVILADALFAVLFMGWTSDGPGGGSAADWSTASAPRWCMTVSTWRSAPTRCSASSAARVPASRCCCAASSACSAAGRHRCASSGATSRRWTPRSCARSRQRYGVTFQQGALYSGLTVLQNVQLPMLEHLQLSPLALERPGHAQDPPGRACRRMPVRSFRRSCPAA